MSDGMSVQMLSTPTVPPVDPSASAVERVARLRGRPEAVGEAVKEFEAYFLSYMMTVMRETMPKGLLENKAGRMFYSFYDAEIGRLAAESGGLGLAAMLQRQVNGQALDRSARDPLKLQGGPTDRGIEKMGAVERGLRTLRGQESSAPVGVGFDGNF